MNRVVHHRLDTSLVAEPVPHDASRRSAPAGSSLLACQIDVNVRVIPRVRLIIEVVREQILVHAARARLLRKPQRDREVTVAGIVEVGNRDVVALSVELRTIHTNHRLAIDSHSTTVARAIGRIRKERDVGQRRWRALAASELSRQVVLATLENALHVVPRHIVRGDLETGHAAHEVTIAVEIATATKNQIGRHREALQLR